MGKQTFSNYFKYFFCELKRSKMWLCEACKFEKDMQNDQNFKVLNKKIKHSDVVTKLIDPINIVTASSWGARRSVNVAYKFKIK